MQKYLTVLVDNRNDYTDALDIFDELEDAQLSVTDQLAEGWQAPEVFFEIYKIKKIATAKAIVVPQEVTVVFE